MNFFRISLLIACALSIGASAFALPSDQGGQQSSSSTSDASHSAPRAKGSPGTSDKTTSRPGAKKTRPAVPPNPAKPKHVPQGADYSTPSPRQDSSVGRQPLSGDSRGLATPPQPSNMTPKSSFSKPPPSGTSHAAAIPTVRHRAPNPAVVGGTVNAKAVNPGAISGNVVHRKP